MRSATILSGIAILVLAATTARAETAAGAATPDPAAASITAKDAAGDKAGAPSGKYSSRNDKAGYNAKTPQPPASSEAPPRRSKWPSYYQSSGDDAQTSKPFGPPR